MAKNRLIDILAKEKFNGKIVEALKYITFSYEEVNFEEYYDELSREEKNFITNAIYFKMKEDGNASKEMERDCDWAIRHYCPPFYRCEHLLTEERVREQLRGDASTSAEYAVPFVVFLTVLLNLFIIPIAIINKSISIIIGEIPFLAVAYGIAVVLKLYNLNKLKKIDKKPFKIEKATCTNIRHYTSASDSDVEHTKFWFNDYMVYSGSLFFEKVSVGTPCYIVRCDGEIKAVYSADNWHLDEELGKKLRVY